MHTQWYITKAIPSQGFIHITASHIDIWTLKLPAAGETLDPTGLLAFLPPAEIERYNRFRNISAQRRYLLGRHMMRSILATRMQCAPREIPITITAGGKPALKSNTIHFNLSHNRTYVIFALSADHPVGIDVESPERTVNHCEIGRQYFHPEEHKELQTLRGEDRKSHFLNLWTLKEAAAKLQGDGMLSHIRKQHFTIAEINQIRQAESFVKEGVFFKLTDLPMNHILALAWRQNKTSLPTKISLQSFEKF